MAQVHVSDDGPGIALQDRPHVFERFRRGADAGVSRSGLVLAIVKSAARQLGARVELLPGLPGSGIAFRLTWPDAESEIRERPRRLQLHNASSSPA